MACNNLQGTMGSTFQPSGTAQFSPKKASLYPAYSISVQGVLSAGRQGSLFSSGDAPLKKFAWQRSPCGMHCKLDADRPGSRLQKLCSNAIPSTDLAQRELSLSTAQQYGCPVGRGGDAGSV